MPKNLKKLLLVSTVLVGSLSAMSSSAAKFGYDYEWQTAITKEFGDPAVRVAEAAGMIGSRLTAGAKKWLETTTKEAADTAAGSEDSTAQGHAISEKLDHVGDKLYALSTSLDKLTNLTDPIAAPLLSLLLESKIAVNLLKKATQDHANQLNALVENAGLEMVVTRLDELKKKDFSDFLTSSQVSSLSGLLEVFGSEGVTSGEGAGAGAGE